MSDIKDLTEEYKEMKSKFTDLLVNKFYEVWKDFWKEHSESIEYISWTQYTPYFNDGDECVFSKNHGFTIKFKNLEYEYEYWIDYDKKYIYNKSYIDNISNFLESLNKIDDEIYETMFGDHVKITATPDGFEVKEYEHD